MLIIRSQNLLKAALRLHFVYLGAKAGNEQYMTDGHFHFCCNKEVMSSNVINEWVKSYLRAALEVDGEKMPGRILAAREAVAARLKDLEGNSDHHAERHEMQSALAFLTCLEDETRIWPTAAIRPSEKTVVPS